MEDPLLDAILKDMPAQDGGGEAAENKAGQEKTGKKAYDYSAGFRKVHGEPRAK